MSDLEDIMFTWHYHEVYWVVLSPLKRYQECLGSVQHIGGLKVNISALMWRIF